jgi:DNA-damage-inducible protein D
MNELKVQEYQGFEQIKQVDDSGNEFWSARDLASALEYVQWKNFSKVIDRAMLACRNSGHSVPDHFADLGKTVRNVVATVSTSQHRSVNYFGKIFPLSIL